MNTKGWLDNIGDRNVHSVEDAEDYIRDKMFGQVERLGYGNNVVLLEGIPIGSCGIYNRPGMEYDDVGFAFLPEYHGKGFAYEATEAVLRDVYDNFELDTVQAITLPTNFASIKLLEKLGLKYIKHFHLPNDPAELLLMQMSLKEKYKAVKNL